MHALHVSLFHWPQLTGSAIFSTIHLRVALTAPIVRQVLWLLQHMEAIGGSSTTHLLLLVEHPEGLVGPVSGVPGGAMLMIDIKTLMLFKQFLVT